MRCVIYLRVSTKEQAERDGTGEGFSLPAQRDACLRHIRDQGWELVDEYSDRGESARSADRPQLQAMLARIAEDRDVDAVVVHKIDRLARNMEDHVAIRALLRRHRTSLVSVTENVEETASGKLVEGIHALMAEFYSSNLGAEVRKGMTQKARQGGWPGQALVGYLNVREAVGGTSVARIVPDPERAPLVTAAFELYATGEWTIEQLATEMEQRGLTSRRRRNAHHPPLSISSIARMLANKAYVGVVTWNDAEYPGIHEPLVDDATFARVQDRLAERSVHGIRERRHNHYLKGLLHCGVCGRRLSIQVSKGTYVYFFCLGQKDARHPTGCREAYTPADRLEAAVENLYQRLELPDAWIERLHTALEDEIADLQAQAAGERERLARQLAAAETERRKLLDAYYAEAIDVATLKEEQSRIANEANAIEDRLAVTDAHLGEWQQILDTAMRFATKCGRAYQRASERTRRRFNHAVIQQIDVRDGEIANVDYHPPFDAFFTPGIDAAEFEYGRLVPPTGFEPVPPP